LDGFGGAVQVLELGARTNFAWIDGSYQLRAMLDSATNLAGGAAC
jgi:hypothetical protein